MAATVQQMQADDDAYVKQATDAQNAKQSQEALQGGEKPEPSFVSKFMTSVGRASTNTLDWAVSAADSINVMRDRAAHDIGAGIITGATNIADTAGSAVSASGKGLAAAEDPAHAEDAEEGSLPTSPIWDHAKGAILDFRDAVAVKDPTLSDNLLQGAAQLAVPFAGYSRAMAGVHGFANLVLAGGLTDATALGPHDPRMADLIALGRHTEGKFGDTLRTLAPDGGAVNAYINYLTDRGDETEAAGRFKNVLDGFGANMLVTPLLHAVASGLKFGTAGLRYAVENGVGSAGDLMPANQVGAVGGDVTPIRAPSAIEEQPTADNAPRIDSSYKPGSPIYEHDLEQQRAMRASPSVRRQAIYAEYVKQMEALRTAHSVDDDFASPQPPSAKIGSEPMDMSLSPEQRALERERVAAARDREEGVTQEPTPESIPANAAAREGAAAQRDAADLSPSSPKGWGSADTSTDAQASTLEKDPVLSHTRSFLQSQLQSGQSGSLHSVASTLSSHIDGSTPDGAFYKDLLARISAKNLDAKIVPPGTGTIPAADSAGPKTAGMYSAKTNAITLYDKAFESNERMVHVFTHEAVHAATVKSIVKDPLVKDALQNVIDHVQAHTQGTLAASHYGFTNPKELVAEAESNPKFQEILKNVPDGMGTAWDTYKKIIGGIFGLSGAAIMSPHFDKLLTKEKTGA